MAVTWVKGTFTRPAGTGTQTIDTGSGVVGKAVILFWTNQTTSGFDESSGHKVLGVGVAASPSQRGCISNVVQNGVDPANVGKGYFTDRVIEVFSDSTPTQESVADFDSFGTGGNAGKFTVNWTENPGGASAIIIHYTFIGGSDVSGAFVGGFTGPTATGNRSYTGMGSAESTSRRWAWACCANDNTNVQQLRANFSTLSSCLLSAKHGSAQADLISDNKADFISWDSDGFTLNHTKVTTSSVRFLGLILGGTFSGRVGSLNLPGVASETDSPSLLSVSMGFRPRGVAFLSTNSSLGELDEEPADYDYGINLGGFDEDGTQGIANLDYETDGGTVPMAAATTTKTTSCWASIDPEWPPGGPPTAGGIEEEVVWTSTNDDGFTVEQIVPSPNGPFVPPGTAQRYVTYVAIGDGGRGRRRPPASSTAPSCCGITSTTTSVSTTSRVWTSSRRRSYSGDHAVWRTGTSGSRARGNPSGSRRNAGPASSRGALRGATTITCRLRTRCTRRATNRYGGTARITFNWTAWTRTGSPSPTTSRWRRNVCSGSPSEGPMRRTQSSSFRR